MLLYLGAFQFVPLASALGLVLVTALVSALVSTALGHRGPLAENGRPLALLAALVALVVVELGARLRTRLGSTRRGTPLHDLAKVGCEPDAVGGKAANLAQLVALGLDVPPGLVVPTTAARATSAATLARAASRWAGGRTVVVRSSYVGEDGTRTFAGVFESVGGVRGDDLAALEAAIRRVLAAADSTRAAAYGGAGAPALIVHAEVHGARAVVASRPWDGRADVVRVELDGGAPVDLDLAVLARGRRAVGGCPDAARIVAAALAVERAFGGPVQLEAVHDGARWWFVQARRVHVEPRATFVAEGAITLDPWARDEATWARRGGLEGLAQGLAGALRAAGLGAVADEVVAGRFRMVGGRAYLDAEVARSLGAARPSGLATLRQLRFALARPAPPDDAADVPRLHAAQAREVLRLAWLTRAVEVTTHHGPLPGACVAFLTRRRDAARDARDALGARLRALEPEPRGVAGPDRIHEPALPERPPGAALPIVDAPFEGRARRADEGPLEGATVLVLPDGDPRWLDEALAAHAVVLERGGTLSHVATVLAERGIPSVLAPAGRRIAHGAGVRFDGVALVEEPA